tara:strand:+ start:1260 stop:1907 length:648 start_codon:yes stop_codon:yes gene_type:complete
MSDYTPKVLVYDDKESQAQDIQLLLEDDFEVYTATPATLASTLRDTIDVIATDVEIIEEGKAAREGYYDVERVLKASRMVRPVIIYSNVADMSKIKNSPMGEFFFGFVERRGFDWEKNLMDGIRRAYAKRISQMSKMFTVWFKKYGIIDRKISEDAIHRLVDADLIQDADLESARNHTYGTIIKWLDNDFLEEDQVKHYEEILFRRLKDAEGFMD